MLKTTPSFIHTFKQFVENEFNVPIALSAFRDKQTVQNENQMYREYVRIATSPWLDLCLPCVCVCVSGWRPQGNLHLGPAPAPTDSQPGPVAASAQRSAQHHAEEHMSGRREDAFWGKLPVSFTPRCSASSSLLWCVSWSFGGGHVSVSEAVFARISLAKRWCSFAFAVPAWGRNAKLCTMLHGSFCCSCLPRSCCLLRAPLPTWQFRCHCSPRWPRSQMA